jgi:hypothetical protein
MTGAALDRDRLAAILGMLGSDHDGEILAAARQAERPRRGAGLTWREILALAPSLPEPRRDLVVESVDDAIDLCRARAQSLTAWELNFIDTLDRQRSAPSPKQIAVLDVIVQKVIRTWARAA